MDLQYVKKLVRLIEGSSVDSIEIEEEGTKIKVSKTGHEPSSNYPHAHVTPLHGAAAPLPPPVAAEPVPAPAPAVKYHEIKSPIVGTFYRSPAPDADAYVEIGQTIQVGTVLCIIEAMKLMNEIESDVSGRIVKILAENAKPVEYGQTLFLVEPV
jgi:acetyl-CoA carboxylase biotin carboxyl carrier protein